MYDWSVPMDAMSTSCSRLKTVDSNPGKRTNINIGNSSVSQAVAHFYFTMVPKTKAYGQYKYSVERCK